MTQTLVQRYLPTSTKTVVDFDPYLTDGEEAYVRMAVDCETLEVFHADSLIRPIKS